MMMTMLMMATLAMARWMRQMQTALLAGADYRLVWTAAQKKMKTKLGWIHEHVRAACSDFGFVCDYGCGCGCGCGYGGGDWHCGRHCYC